MVFWLEKQFSSQITVQIRQTDINGLGVLHGFLAGKTIFQPDYSTN